MRTPHAFAALTLGLTLALTGCGTDAGDDASTTRSPTEHNDVDVAFASDMIQHHAQALTMVDLTLGRDLDPEVQALAAEIRAAQAPEIETMSDWLVEWDAPVPETMRDHANAHGGGGGEMDDMPGMMSADEMSALESAPDTEFQELWLSMMIEHHEGATSMAETEIDSGQHEPTVELAEAIVDSQSAEIETMEGLLD